MVLLLWVYYSSQILFLGAEFTQVCANRFGKEIVPKANAEPLYPGRKPPQRAPGLAALSRPSRGSRILAGLGLRPA